MMKLRSYLKKVGREESGFTLIELMVVVVILGILGSLVVPRIAGDVLTDVKTNTNKAQLKLIQSAVGRWEADNSTQATDWNNAELKTKLTTTTTNGGPYLDDVPTGYYVNGSGTVVAGSDPT